MRENIVYFIINYIQCLFLINSKISIKSADFLKWKEITLYY
jgi:hypothetical protein